MPWFVSLVCAIAMPPSAIRKIPVSAMFESGPAASLAAYERDAPWYAGLAVEMPQWTPRAHSQPFLEHKRGNHLVRTLVSNGHLPSQSTKSVNLNVWSDCSGINSETFALQALSDSIREIIGAKVGGSGVALVLRCYDGVCDRLTTDATCRRAVSLTF